jgi:hypothetical protein
VTSLQKSVGRDVKNPPSIFSQLLFDAEKVFRKGEKEPAAATPLKLFLHFFHQRIQRNFISQLLLLLLAAAAACCCCLLLLLAAAAAAAMAAGGEGGGGGAASTPPLSHATTISPITGLAATAAGAGAGAGAGAVLTSSKTPGNAKKRISRTDTGLISSNLSFITSPIPFIGNSYPPFPLRWLILQTARNRRLRCFT